MKSDDLDHSACGTGCDMAAHAREMGVELDPRTWQPKTSRKPRIYLAGGINGLSDDEALTWRRAARAALEPLYDVLDPMDRDYRGQEAQNVEKIVMSDLADINTCDVILVRAERPSWGTGMEIPHAFNNRKLVIIFGAGDRPSPWLVYHSTHLVADLKAALCAALELAPELAR